jgi:oxaloacetate decarboxylase beta subunit
MGVGAMTDFGPLLANPKTLILGAAAQFGIFATVMGALLLDYYGINRLHSQTSCCYWNNWWS